MTTDHLTAEGRAFVEATFQLVKDAGQSDLALTVLASRCEPAMQRLLSALGRLDRMTEALGKAREGIKAEAALMEDRAQFSVINNFWHERADSLCALADELARALGGQVGEEG